MILVRSKVICPPKKMFLEGDSITENTTGEPSWVLHTSNSFVNNATSGDTLVQIAAQIDAGLAANFPGCDVIIVIGGVNDIGDAVASGSDPVVGMIAAIDYIVQQSVATGVPVLISTITPYGNTSLATAQGIAWGAAYNNYVLTNTWPALVTVFDINALLDADSDGTMDAAYATGDYIHPNQAGDIAIASEIDNMLADC